MYDVRLGKNDTTHIIFLKGGVSGMFFRIMFAKINRNFQLFSEGVLSIVPVS